MENIEKKVVKISKKKLILSIIIILILGIIAIGLYLSRPHMYGLNNNSAGIVAPSVPGSYDEESIYYRNQNSTPSVNDTREFMKTSYDTTIQTRNVKSALRDVKGSIKVANGRIDQLNENTKSGYVRFVIPKINFENFKDEIESITNEKLIIENISSDNLLSQKQSIEQQQTYFNNSLSALQKQQDDLLKAHTQTKSYLENQISSIQNQINVLILPVNINGDPNQIANLQAQKDNLIKEKAKLTQQLLSENSTYNTKNQNLKNEITNTNNQIQNVAKQDSNFTDNIETVNGSIRVEWISMWQLAKIFSPIHPTFIIIILVIIVWYLLKRKNYFPKVELV